jgi:general stress protein CsbA
MPRPQWMLGFDLRGARIGVMRMRVLSALVAVAAVVALTVVLVVSMSRHGHSESAPGVVTVDVARLHAGDVLTTRFAVQAKHAKGYPVIVVDAPHQGFIALVSRSTERGCRVIWVRAPGYEREIVPPARRWDDGIHRSRSWIHVGAGFTP